MARPVPTVKLPSGAEMPMIGLGTWQSKPGEVTEAVKTAIDVGYRHFDCAYAYNNEKEVGEAIKQKIAEGKIKREDLFITTKLWNSRHSPADVRPSMMEQLSLLGLDYVDLYLIHWPIALQPGKENFPRDENGQLIYVDINPTDTYKAMEKLVDEGLARDIGVSNFNSEQLQDVLNKCKIKPATNQVEVHPYFGQKKLTEYCVSRGVVITAYSPLGSAERPWASKEEPTLLEDPKLKVLAEKLNKTPAQIVLKWVLNRGIAIIPKSVTPSRIKENFDILNFELSVEDTEIIEKFEMNQRLIVPFVEVDGKRVYRDRDAPHFPFSIEF